jgi:hypothetical protein
MNTRVANYSSYFFFIRITNNFGLVIRVFLKERQLDVHGLDRRGRRRPSWQPLRRHRRCRLVAGSRPHRCERHG